MSQLEKNKQRLRDCRKTFRYADFARLILQLGYEQRSMGASAGARRTFVHEDTRDIITLHEPHDGEMTRSMVADLREHLKGRGLL